MKPNKFSLFPLKDPKTLALLAVLSALAVAGRILFVFIPNVQPVTSLVIMLTLVAGLRFGALFATLTLMLSNLILGMGFWTIGQILGFLVIVLLTGFFIRPFQNKLPLVWLALFSGFCGFVYGFIQALFIAPLYGFSYFWAYYLAGLSFDALHAIGNIAFYLVLAPILLPLLRRLFS